jgi:hypothetical protein
MPPTKSFRCAECGTTDRDRFYSCYKSLCKDHCEITKTPELRKKILKPYYCVVCGDDVEAHFHTYRKNKCKKHYNTKVSPINFEINTNNENHDEDSEDEDKNSFENKSDSLPREGNVKNKHVRIKIITRKKVE